jgi:hypothetical protein
MRPRPLLRRALLLALLPANPAAVAGASGSGAHAQPRCFGAAARAPYKPCHNRRLRTMVVPKPNDAVLLPNAPCEPVDGTFDSKTEPAQCTFGVPEDEAAETIALIGDSHATHWRGALEAVAQKERWHGVSMTRSGCPLTDAHPRLPRGKRRACIRWNRNVRRWFGEHPEVHSVFISQHRAHVRPTNGDDEYMTAVHGFVSAWKTGLPASVQHIAIIRDTPYTPVSTPRCINRAIKRHQDAGVVCAVPRERALRPDPAAAAAKRFKKRVGLIDFTPFMCSTRVCFEVVGGALVHKDTGHITATFAETFGPYLLSRYKRLLRTT